MFLAVVESQHSHPRSSLVSHHLIASSGSARRKRRSDAVRAGVEPARESQLVVEVDVSEVDEVRAGVEPARESQRGQR